MKQAMSVLTSQSTNEWYTPSWIVDLARETMGGIDLDPASNDIAQEWIRAETYYTLPPIPTEVMALPELQRAAAIRTISHAAFKAQPVWFGRVWLNPPFNDSPMWARRLTAYYEERSIMRAVMLVNSAPGYAWWERLWRERPICMLRERVHFVRPDGSTNGPAKKGQTVAYFGHEPSRFRAIWEPYGRIIEP